MFYKCEMMYFAVIIHRNCDVSGLAIRIANSDETVRSIDRSRREVVNEPSLGSWHMVSMDVTSRFTLSWGASSKKINYDAVALFRCARDGAGSVPRIFKTDGLMVFRLTFQKVFGRLVGLWSDRFRESHIRNMQCTNNSYERFNGTLYGTRVLTKTDSTLVAASLLYYNFVQPHRGLSGRVSATAHLPRAGPRAGDGRALCMWAGEPPASHGDGVPLYAPGSEESACAGALWYVMSLCVLWWLYGPWSRTW